MLINRYDKAANKPQKATVCNDNHDTPKPVEAITLTHEDYGSPEKMIKNFDPAPSRQIQEKIDYFFMPYDLKFSISKSVKFSTRR